jgi:hypothetical protein
MGHLHLLQLQCHRRQRWWARHQSKPNMLIPPRHTSRFLDLYVKHPIGRTRNSTKTEEEENFIRCEVKGVIVIEKCTNICSIIDHHQ